MLYTPCNFMLFLKIRVKWTTTALTGTGCDMIKLWIISHQFLVRLIIPVISALPLTWKK